MLADATPADLLARAPVNGTLALAVATTEPQQAIDVIEKHPGIGRVEIVHRMNGVTRLVVHAQKTRPPVDELAGLLARSNIKITEYYMPRATLDDVFRQITIDGPRS